MNHTIQSGQLSTDIIPPEGKDSKQPHTFILSNCKLYMGRQSWSNHPCEVFGKTALAMAERYKKGDKIMIVGTNRSWSPTNKFDETPTKYTIRVASFEAFPAEDFNILDEATKLELAADIEFVEASQVDEPVALIPVEKIVLRPEMSSDEQIAAIFGKKS